MRWHKLPIIVAMLVTAANLPPVAFGADGDQSKTVSRDEYDKLKTAHEKLQKDFEAFKAANSAAAKSAANDEETRQYREYVDQQLQKTLDLAKASSAGTTRFLITGYANADYMVKDHENNTFQAGFNPIFLWEVTDKLLFQGELEIKFPEDDSTSEGEVNVEFINFTYDLNDYVTLGAGKFLTPFGFFSQHIHPSWINKLPDKPLPLDEDTGLVPYQQIGFFVRGGVPVFSESKIKYDFFVSNGQTLRTAEYAADASELGTLNANNGFDLNNNKALGGRIGILPIPQVEIDYSIMGAQVSPDGSQKIDALLQAVGVNYKQEVEPLGGTIQAMAEYVWWNMGLATYDAGGDLGGPFIFRNDRSGGYAQVSYRPSESTSSFLKDFETVFRYSFVMEPTDAPDRHDRDNYTIGLNYWLNPTTVLKIAYEFDNVRGDQDQNALLMEAAIGF
jgi:hypothetical protein